MAISTDINKFLLEEMFSVYTAAEQRMLERIAKRVKRGVTDTGWTESKMGDSTKLREEIQAILGNTDKIAKAKLSKGIKAAYKAGRRSGSSDLGFAKSIMDDYIPEHVRRWILEAHNLIDGTSFQILRNADDIYRKVIAEAGTSVLTGVDTREAAAQAALNKFAAAGITGFVDKANRRWDLASYVEMATRTTTARAALQGHVDRLTELDHDLIMVSGIAATCEICAPWQGRVLSISGKDEKYPSLDSAKAAGLFHPNCKHTLTAYFPEVDDEGHDHPYANQTDKQMPNNDWLYNKTQEQRYNERQIRKWKRVESVAISPEAKRKAAQKVAAWQAEQRRLIADTGLRRQYKRESIRNRIGDAAKARDDLYRPIPKFEQPPRKPRTPKEIYNKGKNILFDSKWFNDIFGGKSLDERRDIVRAAAKAGAGSGEQDAIQAHIFKLQGYDKKPKLITESELNKITSEGNVAVYRGVGGDSKAPKYVEDFKSGPLYCGKGIFGNGTYTALDRSTAVSYANWEEQNVMDIAIRKDAKIIEHRELTRMQSDLRSEMYTQFDSGRDMGFKMPDEDLKTLYHALDDEGKYATLLGYDAIFVSDSSYYVVLNRTALYVKK